MNRYLVRITAPSQKFVHVEADNMKTLAKKHTHDGKIPIHSLYLQQMITSM